MIKLYNGKGPATTCRTSSIASPTATTPISDVETHHRTMTCCHLCNIALMLGRELKWDPDKEQFVGDEQATMLMSRPTPRSLFLAATA